MAYQLAVSDGVNNSLGAAATSTNWAGISQGITGIFSSLNTFASGYAQSAAYGIQASYQKRVADINTTLADISAEDAIEKGDKAAELYGSQIRQKIGTQRAGYAAQGVDVNTGTAADVQESTREFGELDEQTIKNNAYTAAFGYRMQAIGATAAGQYAQIAGDFKSNNSLLSGGLGAVGGLSKTSYDYFGK